MKLIKEHIEEIEFLTEATEKGKNFYIKGIFLQSEVKNRNGRLYPESVMDKEVNRYITEAVDKNCAYGELNHPNSFTINLDRASHRIVELVKEGKNWIGKALVMDTACGNTVKGIMESGGALGVSSRALGSLKTNNEGINIVQGDFRLSTAADIVGDPSAPDAWVNGIMEGVEWFYDEASGIYKHSSKAKTEISKMSMKKINENKIKMFETFINNIS